MICEKYGIDFLELKNVYNSHLRVNLLDAGHGVRGPCKKPILATNVSETSKLVKHNKFGLLAEPGNFSQYAEFLVKFLTDNDICEKLENNFYNHIISNFNWEYLSEIFETNVIGINKK